MKANTFISHPIGKNIILFNKLKNDDIILFLYDHTQNAGKYAAYDSFIHNGLESNAVCLYAFDANNHKWHPQMCSRFRDAISENQLHLFPMNSVSLSKLENKFEDVCAYIEKKQYSSLRFIIDFGEQINSHNFDEIVEYNQRIIEKGNELLKVSAGKLSHKRKINHKFPLGGITAVNEVKLQNDTVIKLINIYENIIISTKTESYFSFNVNGYKKRNDDITIDAVPKPLIEQIVKKHLEPIVLSLITEKPLCGFDLIKTISQRYYTYLSQGTVYPLLYSLERKGILKVEKKGTKSKEYSLTEQGMNIIQKNSDDFIKAQEFIIGSLRRQPSPITNNNPNMK